MAKAMSEQVMIRRGLLKRLCERKSAESIDDEYIARKELRELLAAPVSAQPAGEVPEVVAYGSSEGLGPVLPMGRLGSSGAPMSCYDLPLMTVAQHTRIVAALQARAVVMPEREDFERCASCEKLPLDEQSHRVRCYEDERTYWMHKGWSYHSAEVARLNGGPASDKIQQARRAAFEKWANQHRMPIGRDGVVVDYSARETDACWQAFNAALDCVVIELPTELHAYTGQPQEDRLLDADRNQTIKQCRDAIESTNLGLRVK